jgi:hypothetical protein
MPFWAIFYCGMIAVSAFFTISVFSKRGAYYIPGQLLSSIFSILMFVFHYDIFIHRPQSVLIIVVMLVYILYWECWENRKLFPVIANDTDKLSTTNFDLSEQLKVSKDMFLLMAVFIVAISLPLVYVSVSVVASYF